jgi:uncharacterized protein
MMMMTTIEIPQEYQSLHKNLSEFVKESTKEFDDSHNHVHMLNVVQNTLRILHNDESVQQKSIQFPDISRLSLVVAWLHDVRDHKYPNSISEEELREYIDSVEPTETDNILEIIANISYSKEAKGLRKSFPEPYQTILDIVTDADRLEALGLVGIERCETFTKEHGGKVPEDVILHCHEKLLRLLPCGYFKTDYGRILAAPLHQEILEYVQKYENP